ncbi:MAG TPA: hypothetical protein VLD38_07860 [Nitrosopumilaceae archaeon]|nr:hypothetical protein [Nitrosopumilaceae archaeon]
MKPSSQVISNIFKNKVSLAIVASVIVASVLLISYGSQTQTFAEDKMSHTDSVNSIAIKTIFHFRAGDEEIDTFKVFSQTSGYIRNKSPVFALQGVVDGDRPLLYEAADANFENQNVQDNYGQFDIDVYLQRGDSTYRHFTYTDCKVQNYWVDTEFDKEETYSGKTQFAVVDKFEFLCSGYELMNPVYEKMIQDQAAAEVQEATKLTSKK